MSTNQDDLAAMAESDKHELGPGHSTHNSLDKEATPKITYHTAVPHGHTSVFGVQARCSVYLPRGEKGGLPWKNVQVTEGHLLFQSFHTGALSDTGH